MWANDRDGYDRFFSNATFKRYNMKLSAKADFYNDEARSQHTVRSITALDFHEHCKKMVKELEEAGISLPQGVPREKYV